MRSTALALAFVLAIPLSAVGQDSPEGTKWTDVDWYRIAHFDFAPGMEDDAMTFIDEHFVSATEAAGTPKPAMLLWHVTGEWDLTVMWHMTEGPSALEWRQSPDNIKWWSAFVAQEGGEEQAASAMAEWRSMVARTTSTIARQSQ